jgi:fibronectin-binding autotransporter adhesin
MSNVSFGVDAFPFASTAAASTGGVTGFGSAVTWGDGADGDVVIGAGTTALARDMFYNSLTVQSGGILKPQGFRIFVKTATQVDAGGTINDNGNDAGIPPAIGGAQSAIGWLQNASGGGGLGRNTTGVGTAGSTVGNCLTTNGSAFARGGAGASAANPSAVGGTGGPATIGGSLPGMRLLTVFTNFRGYLGAAFSSTTGGGGGGVDITAGGTGTSGGGGGAGRSLWIASKTIILNGTISANGGNGANAVGTGAAKAGGGGGGAGGIVVVQTTTPAANLSGVTVNGGAAGTSFGTMFSPSVGGDAGHKLIIVFAE